MLYATEFDVRKQSKMYENEVVQNQEMKKKQTKNENKNIYIGAMI